ncbi:MAG: hypothetical protein ABJA62_11460, partial [Luteimonas sp.]
MVAHACYIPIKYGTPGADRVIDAAKARRMVVDDADPYQWLEGVNDPRALAWVETQNTKTLS